MTATRRRATKRAKITADATSLPRSGIIRGPVHAIHPAIRRVGAPYQYDSFRHAYLVPIGRLNDVCAALEDAGHVVDMQLAAS